MNEKNVQKENPRLAEVTVSPSCTIRSLLETIQRNGLRGAIICDEDQELLGIAMDSDIRRAVLRNTDMGVSVRTIMRTAPFVIDVRMPIRDRHQLLVQSGKLLAPIVDGNRRVVDYLEIGDVLKQFTSPDSMKNSSIMPPSKILVIGGAGYIGSMLVEALLNAGYPVRVLDLLLYGKHSTSHFASLQEKSDFEFIRGDCRDEETVRQVLEGIDAVVHLGEIVGDPACQIDEAFTIDTNYAATHMIVESCMKLKIKRFIFFSSCSVYGHNDQEVTEESHTNPVSLYARCKVESEKEVLSCDIDDLCPTVLRLATVHGQSYRQRFDLVVNYLTIKALAEGKIQIMGGKQWRPFVAVRDICRGTLSILQASSETVKSQIFNLGDSRENYQMVSIGELVKDVVGDVEVEVLEEQEDPRNYRVSFEKVCHSLGFSAAFTVRDSIHELALAYREDNMFRDYHSTRYHNLLAFR